MLKQEKHEISYKFVDKTEQLVALKTEPSKQKIWDGNLEKGVYILIPSTTGCRFKKRKHQPSSDVHLTEMSPDTMEITLAEPYKKAIKQIFHQLDLDESGTLTRAQFNLYNWRTSGMELTVSSFLDFLDSRELKILEDLRLGMFLENPISVRI